MIFVIPYLENVKTVVVHATPGMPPEIWWLSAAVLAILALAAMVDAFTTTIPDSFIFLGLAAVTGTIGLVASWDIAALHLRHALIAGFVIWLINYCWYRNFHHDALGMGDAKWTMLAVSCFGYLPALFAWGIGAIIAVCFIGVTHLAHCKVTRVTFAPFLFIGLMIGLYWLRFIA